MELNAFDRKHFVSQAHDDASAVVVAGPGADLEIGRKSLFANDERVIANGGHGRLEAAKDGAAVVLDAAGFAVHESFGADDLAAKSGANGLMSEADSEKWNLAGKMTNQFDADARILRRAGAGGDHDAIGMEGFEFIDGDFVVAAHLDARTQFAQVLDQVVGKGVVIVENEDHVVILSVGGGVRFWRISAFQIMRPLAHDRDRSAGQQGQRGEISKEFTMATSL